MFDGKSILGVILARGGSKGLPRKNVREIGEKPLVARTIGAGLRSEFIDRLVLSSDDDEIMAIAEEYNCEVPFRRPDHLAQDDTPSVDALVHALDQLPSFDFVALLQPTSPLRTEEDIDATIARCHETEAPACISLVELEKPAQWMFVLSGDDRLRPLVDRLETVTRRQDAEPVYAPNGAVNVARTEWIREQTSFRTEETAGYVMPKERSPDVDSKLDLEWCRFLFDERNKKHEE
jgi:N-acylneuraminate cytidylyltransferase